MATAIVTRTKNKETFLKQKKEYKANLAITKRIECHLHHYADKLMAIANSETATDKDKIAAMKTAFDIYNNLVESRNQDQINRLKLEIEHLDELLAHQDATQGFIEMDEEEESEEVPSVDFSKIVPIE